MIRALCILSAGAALVLLSAGCAARPVEVKGVVQLDGTPVEGATVVLITEDGSRSYSGFTASDGSFSVSSPSGPGALPGEYRVTVVKSKAMPGAEAISPGDSDYMKQMEKQAKDAAKNQPGKMTPMPGKMTLPPPTAGTAVKTELPALYANPSTSPLRVKVPPDNQPVVFALESPKKKG